MGGVSEIKRANILGVGLSATNMAQALEIADRALEQKTKGYVCVTGVHGVMEAQQDASFRAILNDALLNTPDGMPMVRAGRWQGFRNMARVYGPDLMLAVCAFTSDKGYSHFLYGGAEGVAQELKQRLEKRFPGLKIVGTYTPPFRPLNPAEEAELIRVVRETKPNIFWIALSTPKQEQFMVQYWQKLDATLLFGVGAAFDFHAGQAAQIVAAQVQLFRLEQDVHQAQPFHAVIIVLARAADHESVAGAERIGFLAGDMNAAARRDDDDFRKLVGVQPERLLRVAPFHGDGKAIRVKPVFALQGGMGHCDGRGRRGQ